MSDIADPRTTLEALGTNAESALAETSIGNVRLGEPELLRERARNKVARFRVLEGASGAPATVIVKAVESHGDRTFDPNNDAADQPAFRFYNEWTANRFLTECGVSPPVGARLLGANRNAGLIILEDLGTPHSLADAMQADDRPALEAGLEQYAAGMGRLHAVTMGKEKAFDNLRRAVGGSALATLLQGDNQWRDRQVPAFLQLCADLAVPVAEAAFTAEAEAVGEAIENPGPFLAFSPGDTCPDNHFLAADGGVRFFDFEFAGFAHASLDAAYFYLPFPTCWCVNRLPSAMILRMEAAYRRELAAACPPAAEDSVFLPAVAQAVAFWTVRTLFWGTSALEKDDRWGIATMRQRHPLRLENAASLAERAGFLPVMGAAFRALATTLRDRWSDTEPMPFYPAFRSSLEENHE